MNGCEVYLISDDEPTGDGDEMLTFDLDGARAEAARNGARIWTATARVDPSSIELLPAQPDSARPLRTGSIDRSLVIALSQAAAHARAEAGGDDPRLSSTTVALMADVLIRAGWPASRPEASRPSSAASTWPRYALDDLDDLIGDNEPFDD